MLAGNELMDDVDNDVTSCRIIDVIHWHASRLRRQIAVSAHRIFCTALPPILC